MAATFKFELVSPERILLSGDAEQVVVPGGDGEFTVLAGHAPVISTLRPGLLAITMAGGQAQRIFVKGGFAEVNPESLTVLAEHAIPVNEIDADLLADEREAAEALAAAATTDVARTRAAALVDVLSRLEPARA